MNLPSEKARDFAEEVCDFVRHGLTRNDAILEIAGMFDEANDDLVRSVGAVVEDAAHHDGAAEPGCLAQLKHVLPDYEPLRITDDSQGDLFRASEGVELRKVL